MKREGSRKLELESREFGSRLTSTIKRKQEQKTRTLEAMALCRRMSMNLSPLFQPLAAHSPILSHSPTMLKGYARPSATMQVVEHEHEYRVEIDAPGLTPSAIKVTIDDGILSVEGKRDETHEKKDDSGAVVYSERRSAAFVRRMALPRDYDPKEIAARAQNGVVSIVVKKKEENDPTASRRVIPVEGDNASGSPSEGQKEPAPADHHHQA